LGLPVAIIRRIKQKVKPNVSIRIFRLDQYLMMKLFIISCNFDSAGRWGVDPEFEFTVNSRFIFIRPVCWQSAENRDLEIFNEIVKGHPEAAVP
jgi:hypothetical protein